MQPTNRPLISLVDDEENIRELVSYALQQEGYRVATYRDGEEAWTAFRQSLPDLVILDIIMPRMDGLELCRRIRNLSETLPLIFLTSKDEEFDKVLGLELGADDYLCKPFSTRELLARVKVLFRRLASVQGGDSDEEDRILRCGSLEMDRMRHGVLSKGQNVPLTVTEFRILEALIRQPGYARTREQLLQGADEANTEDVVPAEQRLLYRIATYPVRLYRRLFRPPEPPLESAGFYINTSILLGPEIQEALEGRYGAMTRISTGGQRSVTLYSAIPIRSGGSVVGAVLVSQSTYRILRDLYELRLEIFTVFLVSLAVTIALSLLASTTIAAPVRKLCRQAREILDHRGRLRGHIRFTRRRDEIGDLSRSLEEMTRKLQGHIEFVESFASDISHEFKNPLASIRSAGEMIARTKSGQDRDRGQGMIGFEDDGPGIPEQHLEKIFDRFFSFRPAQGLPF